jgi:hypothetical protein
VFIRLPDYIGEEKITMLTPHTGFNIGSFSVLCCPNLHMISRIFKHSIRKVGLCQGRHSFFFNQEG